MLLTFRIFARRADLATRLPAVNETRSGELAPLLLHCGLPRCGVAVGHALNQWDSLQRHTTDGRLSIGHLRPDADEPGTIGVTGRGFR